MRKILSFLSIFILVILLVSCVGKIYTITFETNGGSAVDPIEVNDGQIPSMPADPTRDGYIFDGWYLDDALVSNFDDASSIEEDITVYAAWISIVAAAKEALDLGNLTGLTNASARIIMPTSSPDYDDVSISWEISDTDVISTTGVINQPAHEDGNATVTLTATLTYDTQSDTKIFTATVIALPDPADTEPLIDEDFTGFSDGSLPETGFWGPVSGKSGSSLFTVVSDAGLNIPDSSKALKIEAFTERQVEGAMPHTYDMVVIEADVMQTAESGGSAINIQTSSSSPVIGFGVQGAGLFYRTDNGTQYITEINTNQWYRIRLEADLVNKTIQVFYYLENGQLSQMTPGKVTFEGTTSLQSIFIRSGSSTTVELQQPAYITNIVANRMEALPRPTEIIALGEVEGIAETVNVEEGTSFIPSVPVVYNAYGELRALIESTEYTLDVSNPVNVNVADDYTVVYTITNVSDINDVIVINQTVTVYSPVQANVIDDVTNTEAQYPDLLTDITVVTQQAAGDLYLYYSDNAVETAATIKTATPVTISSTTTIIEDVDASLGMYVHVIVVHNGDSNIFVLELAKQALVEIATAQEFFDAIHLSTGDQAGKYFILTDDIDFASYTWVDGVSDWRSTLDGDGHVISNLTVAPTARGGIFDEIEDGAIINIVFDNIVVNNTTSNTAALLVGEVNGTGLLSNIVVMNSTIDGNGDYAAMLVGRVRGSATMLDVENVAVINSVMNGHKDYAGGLVAGQDAGTEISFNNIYLKDFDVNEAIDDTGQMVGGIIGRGQSTLTISNVVAINLTVDAIKNVGGLVGKIDTVDTTNVFTNIFLQGEVTVIGSTNVGSLVGNVESVPTVTNAWTAGFANADVAGLSVDVANQTDLATVQNIAWWSTNMADLYGSLLWTDLGDGSLALVNYTDLLKPLLDVTLDYNLEVLTDEVIQVREDDVFEYEPEAPAGYVFAGWYADAGLTTLLADPYVVTGAVTIYGKLESVPASTVSFDLGDAVATEADQMINYGELATEPTIADEMIGGVMKEVTGWTLDGLPFDFSTPITESITLVAVWETKVFTVTFDTGDSSDTEAAQMVDYNGLAIEPVTDPIHTYASNFTFVEWQVGGSTYDFNTPITSDITVVAYYSQDSVIEISTTQGFYDMAVNSNDYNFVLTADLDFTAFTWDVVGGTFSGTFDGQEHTVSNISINAGDRAGIFKYFRGMVDNLILENVTVVSTGRAGVIAGEIDAETAVLNNVHFVNVSVTGASDNGVGAIAGVITDGKGALTATIISVIDSSFTNNNKNVGALVGYVRGSGATTMHDIYLYNVTVHGLVDQVGGVVGYVRNPLGFSLSNVVIDGVSVTQDGAGGYAASVVGRIDTSTVINIQDLIVVDDTITAVKYANTIVGRYTTADNATFTLTNVYSGTTTINVSASGQAALTIIDPLTIDSAWWTTNLPTISGSLVWDEYGNMMAPSIIIGKLPVI